jgi:S-(hydroxymethyl)glutathione dehydrogenase / alcohol dehydrogenase
LMDIAGSGGFDAVVDTTGNSKVRELAYEITSNVGRTIYAGVPHSGEDIHIDSFPIHFGRKMVGSHGGETKPDVDIPRYVRLFQRGELKLHEQIAERFALSDINKAFERVQAGVVGRCMIDL